MLRPLIGSIFLGNLVAPVHCRIILWWTFIREGNKRPGVGERRGLSLHLDFVQSWLQGRREKRRDGSRKGRRASVKSHCDYECNCSSGAQGPCSSDGARRCFMHGNREEESEKERKREESGRERQTARMFAIFFFSLTESSFSPPPSLLSILFSPPLSSLLSSLPWQD